MSIILDFIHGEIEKQTYEILLHADDEKNYTQETYDRVNRIMGALIYGTKNIAIVSFVEVL